ncbi:hypothetical protein AB0D87_46440 [Streptomyces sp. NPDC048342]|uniref:hypothetical protein n=1 Tax=unclassified Streptomyces TaxID=2593676 RepID=UPI00342D4FD8
MAEPVLGTEPEGPGRVELAPDLQPWLESGEDPRAGGEQRAGGLLAGAARCGEAGQQFLAGQPPAGEGVVQGAA